MRYCKKAKTAIAKPDMAANISPILIEQSKHMHAPPLIISHKPFALLHP
jgi:hypothetical protein